MRFQLSLSVPAEDCALNEVNFSTLISLLNLLSIWLELGVLDLRPFLVRFHDHLFVYLHLPAYLLRKLIKALLFFYKWLKKFEPPNRRKIMGACVAEMIIGLHFSSFRDRV